MIYLDSSALVKLVVQERESDELQIWLGAQGVGPWVSSQLARVEVVRTVRLLRPSALSQARAIVSALDLIPLTPDVIDAAAEVGEPRLRSLDSLHLASALMVGEDLRTFVAYDVRLLAAAQAAGLSTAHPGR